MFRERTLVTACTALLATVLFGLIKPVSPISTEDAAPDHTRFFILKTHAKPEYDIVVVGDSRGLQGISPGEMGRSLPADHIFNFCFHAGGMNREIYQYAEQLLAPNADRPLILLAPTSLSFLAPKAANLQFHEFRDKPRDQVWLYTLLPEVARWFQPLRLSSVAFILAGITPSPQLQQVFHPSGWIETDQIPHDDIEDLEAYAQRFIGHSCEEHLIDELFSQTAEWTRRGIDVYCVLPPAYSPRVAIEDSMLGFDRDRFTTAFENAGGLMLSIEDSGYETYDGSHLTGPSARLFSYQLGQAIARHRQ